MDEISYIYIYNNMGISSGDGRVTNDQECLNENHCKDEMQIDI